MIIRVRGLASPTAILAGLLSFCLSGVAFAAGPGWYTSFEQAVQAARQQGRPIFVDFSTSWCSICKQMDRTTLSDTAIISRLDNFIKVKVDGDARPDLCSTYGVEAYPTFVQLDSTGRMIEKREGFMRSQDMATTLDRIWQGVAASMAIAQANRKPEAAQPAASASNGTKPLLQPDTGHRQKPDSVAQEQQPPAKLLASDIAKPTEVNSSARNPSGTSPSSRQNLYNADAQLQGGSGSVYAATTDPNSAHRSRFADTGDSGLRQLAEATAKPDAAEASNSSNASDKKAPIASRDGDLEISKVAGETPAPSETSKKTPAKTDEKVAIVGAIDPVTAETDKRGTAKPPIVVASADSSPVLKSRLAGISESQLPKPLLSRTGSRIPEPMNPAPTVVSGVTPKADPLATIRRLRGEDSGAKPTAVSNKAVTIAASTGVEAKAPQPAGQAAEIPQKTSEPVAVKPQVPSTVSEESKPAPSPVKTTTEATTPRSDAKTGTSDADGGEKTASGATKSDIERWMKDADGKLVSNRKTEARAMYSKVVDKDPENKFGKSDMAYVKMVSLIVDRDSDLLRRQAYNKIKDFESRYPDSDHKDYYTLIRAILAADLNEITEASKLLGGFPEQFPDSKYLKVAHDTWKSLPKGKKDSGSSSKSKSKSSSSGSESRKGRSSDKES